MTATILNQAVGRTWTAIHGDCVEALRDLPDNSVDFSVYSPPFSSLYIYSDSERDMGNVGSDAEFQAAYALLVREKLRVTKPGRLTAIHVKDLVYYSNASDKGDRGLRDFTGACIATHVAAGWSFHSRHTIWRCPVREMTKAKPDGLLFKNFRIDAARNRAGLPEYLVAFRKWGPGMDETPPIVHDEREFPLDTWRQWASPVWNWEGDDLPETDVLNVKAARDYDDEKHLCPMPLNITNRAIRLWSNPGDVVLSPFMGIGSEGVAAMRARRRFIGVELKDSYFAQAVRYIGEAEEAAAAPDLFNAA
ncbi:MAG: site-specific DNA-methyltransferase [Hyphomicrobiales bacterium]|nr:site-specific DNA-methyltransferase [Hyphomicrobiales bacterium]